VSFIRSSSPYLILVAFITGNSSLEPLIEGLYAHDDRLPERRYNLVPLYGSVGYEAEASRCDFRVSIGDGIPASAFSGSYLTLAHSLEAF